MEIILRPLILLVFLLAAAVIARLLHRIIPDGKIKEILYRKHEVVPTATDSRPPQ
jgi:hypothetical protein